MRFVGRGRLFSVGEPCRIIPRYAGCWFRKSFDEAVRFVLPRRDRRDDADECFCPSGRVGARHGESTFSLYNNRRGYAFRPNRCPRFSGGHLSGARSRAKHLCTESLDRAMRATRSAYLSGFRTAWWSVRTVIAEPTPLVLFRPTLFILSLLLRVFQ